MDKRERALEIVEEYAWYHGGTATVSGFLGGQFGLDRIPLTALTIKMINSICQVYEISDKAARNIHIARAIGRLTINGTAIGNTLLNWLPLGSFANGLTSYYLTLNAGKKCVNEIEQEQMNVSDQLKNGLVDVAVTAAAKIAGPIILQESTGITEDIAENVKNALELDSSDSAINSAIIDFINRIPSEFNAGIDSALGSTVRESLVSCIKNKGDIKPKEIIRNVFFASLISTIGEHNRISEEELKFRLLQKDKYYKTFEQFFDSTSAHFEKIANERGVLEAVKGLMSSVSTFIQQNVGLRPEEIINTLMDNPYDRAISQTYESYLSLISCSDNHISAYAKTALLYVRLRCINIEYNLPVANLHKKDDRLIYMIAGRIKECVDIFENEKIDVIAYKISEYVDNQETFLFPKFNISLWGLDNSEWNKLYGELRESVIEHWKTIITKAKGEECAWSDCAMAVVQVHILNSVFFDGFKIKEKSDKLIYEVSSSLKKSSRIISHFTNEEVAYYTSIYFDKWIS